jgi:hypothetical protein
LNFSWWSYFLKKGLIGATIFFFFAKQGERQTSGGYTDIPTRLAPREASVLCQSNSKILLKKGEKNIQGEGGRGQNPQRKNKRKHKKTTTKIYNWASQFCLERNPYATRWKPV